MPDSAEKPGPVSRLLEVMAALRGEGGCPWDRRQTHRSLVPYLIEETYEAVEAIESGADAAMREELGDVLLQVVFHARIAEEQGRFNFDDVAATLADKLVHRHPHVFDGQTLDGPRALRRLWHDKKMAGRDSALDGVPAALPALQRAAKVSSAAAQAGFEWRNRAEIWDKAREELEEFRRAIEARNENAAQAPRHALGASGEPSAIRAVEAGTGASGRSGPDDAELELGDLLFALVQMARWQRIDPEGALRRSTAKFAERFRWMERRLREQGGESFPERWEALWAEAKAAVPG